MEEKAKDNLTEKMQDNPDKVKKKTPLTFEQHNNLYGSLGSYILTHRDLSIPIIEYYNDWEHQADPGLVNMMDMDLLICVLEWMDRARRIDPDFFATLMRIDGFKVEYPAGGVS